jgi:hypothetical protein
MKKWQLFGTKRDGRRQHCFSTLLCLFFFCSFVIPCTAQHDRFDSNWLFSSPGEGMSVYLDFNESPMVVKTHARTMRVLACMSVSHPETGQLLFYSNGCTINDRSHAMMQNGDSISPGLIQQYYCNVGSFVTQSMMAMRDPGDTARYFLFNLDMLESYGDTSMSSINPLHLYYHIIDMRMNNGLGVVVEKCKVAISDTLANGGLHAIRHTNGTDWWIVMPKANSNCHYISLLDASGVQNAQLQCGGDGWDSFDDSYVTSSPDGRWFAKHSGRSGLMLYQFDTETGAVTLKGKIYVPPLIDTQPTYSAAFSGNSRYLYASLRTQIYQYDMLASDLEASRQLIGESDGSPWPDETTFAFMALGPDGKIYISTPGSNRYLQVINHPNCPGTACDLQLRGVSLDTWSYWTMPSFPHYRNPGASDLCTNSTMEATSVGQEFTVMPNPAYSSATLLFARPIPASAEVRVHSHFGVQVLDIEQVLRGTEQINLDLMNLPAGMYYVLVRVAGERAQMVRLVVAQ